MEDHINSLVQNNPNMTDEDYNTMVSTGQFNPYAPLVTFENSKQFTSQGSTNRALIDQWYLTESLDVSTCPFKDKAMDAVLGAMISSDSKYIIGNTECQAEFGNPPTSAMTGACWGSGISTFAATTSTNRRGIVSIQLQRIALVFSVVKSECVYAKKNNFTGLWFPAWTMLSIRHLLAPQDISCNPYPSTIFRQSSPLFLYRHKRDINSFGYFPLFWWQQAGVNDFVATGTFGSVEVSNNL